MEGRFTQRKAVNLTAVRYRTEFVDEYEGVEEGQSRAEYEEELIANGNWIQVEDEEGVEDVEATYEGWVGFYDDETRQREQGLL